MRSRQVILKIVSAVVGLAVIAVGAWMSDSGDANASTLILAGLAILGGVGTIALPRLTEAAEPAGRPPSKGRRWRPPTLPVLMAIVLGGCGASALGIQADAAAVLGTAMAAADVQITDVRAGEMASNLDAARADCADGCTEDEAAVYLARHDAIIERWAPALACRLPAVLAVRAWIDGVELAALAPDEGLALATVIGLAGSAVGLYVALVRCVGDATGLRLPDVPPEVAAIVGLL